MAWPNNGNNKAPTPGANVTVEEGDEEYIAALGSVDKYVAREYTSANSSASSHHIGHVLTRPLAVSAWFSTHFGPEVSYSKNWVFPSDL